MNNIKIDYGPFTKGFLEELRKVKANMKLT
jgi:hypothetical protein